MAEEIIVDPKDTRPNDEILTETVKESVFEEPLSTLPLSSTPILTKIPREIDVLAAKRRDDRKLPRPPGRNLTFNQLDDWMKLLTPEMWSHVTIYVYRVRPVINRKLVDPEAYNYIDKLGRYFTEDYIIEHHGGGDYSFEINDNDLPTKQNIASGRVSVDMNQYWPKLNYLELDLNSKFNTGYITSLKGQGILNNEGKPVNSNLSGNNSNSGLNTDTIKEILGFVSNMTKDQQAALRERVGNGNKDGVVELLLERMKQDDPNKQTTTMLSLLTAVQGMLPKQDSSNSMLDRVMAIQQKSFDTVIEIISKTQANNTINNPAPTPTDPFAMLDKMLEVKEKLDGLGGNNNGKIGWQDRAIDAVERIGVPIFENITKIWMLNKQSQINNPNQPQTQQSSGVDTKGNVRDIKTGRSNSANPFNNPSMQIAPPEENIQQMPQPQPQQSQPITISQEILQLIQQYGQLIANAITGGVPGWEFGYDVSRLAGVIPHNRIKQIGMDNVISVAKQIPEFWNIVGQVGEETVKVWLEEFVDFERLVKEHEGDS